MPIYTYICNKCSKEFDLLEGVTKEKAKKVCPTCGSKSIKKTFASFGVGKEKTSLSQMQGNCSTCPHGNSCGMM
ncbi:MAG: hypothetical protein KAI43_02525 [Candidatus Aureabacteria bacterium]|nr:hypothetical protein [Candidatus Auribacterota bacterium]